ncbi:MAG TPA: hypothetical protein DCY20_06265 [Firmicutes bacterium]|nr:hypothetical protein [Bacillota bacterium]
MTNTLYKNPVLACIVINSLTLIFYLFLIKNGHYLIITATIIIGLFNKQIMNYAVNLTSKERAIISFSFVITIVVVVLSLMEY